MGRTWKILSWDETKLNLRSKGGERELARHFAQYVSSHCHSSPLDQPLSLPLIFLAVAQLPLLHVKLSSRATK